MYLKKEVLPSFHNWINSLKNPINIDDAKQYGMYFIAKYIDPKKSDSRGDVYDLFEDIKKYGEIKKLLYGNQMKSDDTLRTENLCKVSQGIIWAVQHDGFDSIKYDPIKKWGIDIEKAGKEPSM